MKTSGILVALLFLGLSQLANATPASTTQDPTVPSPTDFRVVDRGANHKVWQRETYEKSPAGNVITHVHKYTELATGMHYQDANGQWAESSETIEIQPDGSAAALKGQQQAYYPPDIYNGAIEMVTADGKQLYARPLGIFYFDGTNTVMIAELTNSVGHQQIPDHRDEQRREQDHQL